MNLARAKKDIENNFMKILWMIILICIMFITLIAGQMTIFSKIASLT